MELLLKDDIEVLDYIVNTCYEKNALLDETDLRTPKELESISDSDVLADEKFNYYRVYFDIIERYKITHITTNGTFISIEPLNYKTKRFIDAGGFEKLYEEQLENEIYERKIKKGNLANATNSIWTKKTYWFTFGIAIAGFIIACIALYYSLIKP